MNEQIIELNFLEKDENGRLKISKEVVEKLKELDTQITDLNDEENFIRHQILDKMIENNIDKCSSYGMTFTQVMPKAKGTFDVESFLMNESEEVVKCFTSFDETEEFDFETFKKENPELYKKYTKTNISPIVDTTKLEKTLTPVFNKYWTEIPSDKPITLRITAKKGE